MLKYFSKECLNLNIYIANLYMFVAPPFPSAPQKMYQDFHYYNRREKKKPLLDRQTVGTRINKNHVIRNHGVIMKKAKVIVQRRFYKELLML